MAFLSFAHGLPMLALLILVTLVAISSGCSPTDESSEVEIHEKFTSSDIVALGKVLKSVHNEARDPQGWNVSNVEFQVNCIYKGDPIRQNVIIEDVGYIPGLCLSIDLQVDRNYIVYLTKGTDGKLTHEQVVPDEGVESYIDEVLSSDCAIISYPTDVLEGNRFLGCTGTNDNYVLECSLPTGGAITTQEPTTETSKKEPESDVSDQGDKGDDPENKNADTPTEVGESKGKNSAESKISNIFLILSLLCACFFYA